MRRTLLVLMLSLTSLPCSLFAADPPEPKQFEGNRPALIKTAADGTLSLPASACEVYGPELEYMPEDRALGYWHQTSDYCVWQLDVARAGTYAVLIEWSCDIPQAGNFFELTTGDAKLVNRVPTSGSWQRHLWAQFGQIDLPAGKTSLSIRPQEGIKGALMDLREVKLIPIVAPK